MPFGPGSRASHRAPAEPGLGPCGFRFPIAGAPPASRRFAGRVGAPSPRGRVGEVDNGPRVPRIRAERMYNASSLSKSSRELSVKRLLQTLNEPFILWLLSSVVVGFLSWQYAEIQTASDARTAEEQQLKRAKLVLKLQLKDVQFFVQQGDDLTVAQLGTTLKLLQYSGINQRSEFYVPTIPNVMLDIDVRTDFCGLEQFQDRIYRHATELSATLNRLWSRRAQPNARIFSQLPQATRTGLAELVVLADEVQEYYAQKTPKCDAT